MAPAVGEPFLYDNLIRVLGGLITAAERREFLANPSFYDGAMRLRDHLIDWDSLVRGARRVTRQAAKQADVQVPFDSAADIVIAYLDSVLAVFDEEVERLRGLDVPDPQGLLLATLGLPSADARRVHNYYLGIAGSKNARRLRDQMAANLRANRLRTIAAVAATQFATDAVLAEADDDATLVWIVVPDERLCPLCAPMRGQERRKGFDFLADRKATGFKTYRWNNGKASGETVRITGTVPLMAPMLVEGPPLHPYCRCRLEEKEAGQRPVGRARRGTPWAKTWPLMPLFTKHPGPGGTEQHSTGSEQEAHGGCQHISVKRERTGGYHGYGRNKGRDIYREVMTQCGKPVEEGRKECPTHAKQTDRRVAEWQRRLKAKREMEARRRQGPIAKHPGPGGKEQHSTGSSQEAHGEWARQTTGATRTRMPPGIQFAEIVDRLNLIAGTQTTVIAPASEPDAKAILERGQKWESAIPCEGGEPNRCHRNTVVAVDAARKEGRDAYIATGYALTKGRPYGVSGGVWISHTWMVKDGQAYETLPARGRLFDLYYGAVLDAKEEQQFARGEKLPLQVRIAKHPGPSGAELHSTGTDQTAHAGHTHGKRKGEEYLPSLVDQQRLAGIHTYFRDFASRGFQEWMDRAWGHLSAGMTDEDKQRIDPDWKRYMRPGEKWNTWLDQQFFNRYGFRFEDDMTEVFRRMGVDIPEGDEVRFWPAKNAWYRAEQRPTASDSATHKYGEWSVYGDPLPFPSLPDTVIRAAPGWADGYTPDGEGLTEGPAHIGADWPGASYADDSTRAKVYAVLERQMAALTIGPEGEVWTRLPDESKLDKVMRQDTFKTVFDTRSSTGRGANRAERVKSESTISHAAYMEGRTAYESASFGTSHPLYGYITTDPDGGMTEATGHKGQGVGYPSLYPEYGTVAVRLRDVRDRTSYYYGDSLNMAQSMYEAYPSMRGGIPAPMNQPHPFAGPFAVYAWEGEWRGRTQGEVEATIHGGLGPHDIAEVVFYGDPQTPVTTLLDKAGIPWRVANPGQPNYDKDAK